MMPSETRTPPPLWRKLLPWGIAVVCLAAVVRIIAGNRQEMALILGRLESGTILWALLLSALNIILFSLRSWQVIEKCSGLAIPYLFWQRVFVLSQFLNTALPQAGSLYRAVRLKKEVGLGYTSYVGGYFTYVWLSVLFLLFCSALVLAAWDFSLALAGIPLALLPALGGLALFFAPQLAAWLCRVRLPAWRLLAWLVERLKIVFVMGPLCLQSLRFTLAFLLLALASLLGGVLVLFVVCHGIGLSPSLLQTLVLFVVIQLSGYLAVTPGNIGVQELLYGAVGMQLGFSLAGGVMLALLLRVLHLLALAFLVVLLAAVPVVWQRRPGGQEDKSG